MADETTHRYLRRLRLKELQAALAFFPPSGRVLEIGAGAGWQAAELERRGFRVQAVEVYGSIYESCRVWPVRMYDGTTLPFDDGAFDVVWSSNVLEHIADVESTLDELRRVLTPGGVAVHVLPTFSWRFWTTLMYYTELPSLQAEIWRRHSGRAALYRGLKLLVPDRHGERGNVWTEFYYFSRFYWRRQFERCGWQVTNHRTCRLFYTGSEALGQKLPLRLRRVLSYALGSACAIYVARPG